MSLPGRLAAFLLLLCLAVVPAGGASAGWNGDSGAIALEALVDAPARESLVRKTEAAPGEHGAPDAPLPAAGLLPSPACGTVPGTAFGHDALIIRARAAACPPRAPPLAQV